MSILKYKEIRQIDDSTMFHESIDWSDRFARKIEKEVLLRVYDWLNLTGNVLVAEALDDEFLKETTNEP